MREAAARRHALRRGFEWHDHRGPFRMVSEAQARQYDELGFPSGHPTPPEPPGDAH